MKRNQKIALCAVTAALSSAIMLVSYFPYFTYAVPAISGLCMMLPLIEISAGWAFSSYAVSAVLSLFLAEKESAVLYVCLLGFYPILKALIEKIGKQWAEWIVKILVFNSAALISYFIASFVFSVSFDDFGKLGIYGAYIFLGICNVAFVIYDIAISRISILYMNRIHNNIRKIFK